MRRCWKGVQSSPTVQSSPGLRYLISLEKVAKNLKKYIPFSSPAQNTFSHQNRSKNMDTVTIKKITEITRFLPDTGLLGQNQFFRQIKKVHATARQMVFSFRRNRPSSFPDL